MENKNKKYKIKNIILAIILGINVIVIAMLLYFLSPVNKNGEDVTFVIEQGT